MLTLECQQVQVQGKAIRLKLRTYYMLFIVTSNFVKTSGPHYTTKLTEIAEETRLNTSAQK